VTAVVVGALWVGAAAEPSGPRGGAAVFKARCARCHGESGKTDTPGARALKVRPLANDARLAGMTSAEIVRAIEADAKHEALGALTGVDDAELRAAAAFVKELAGRR